MSNTMDDGTTLDPEAESLIQELLDAGFAYDRSDRLQGFAHQGDDGDVSDDEVAGGDTDDGDAGDDGAASGGSEPVGDDGGDVVGGDGGGTTGDTGGGTADTGTGAHSPSLNLNGTPLTAAEAETLLGIRKLLLDHPELGPKFNELATETITGRKLAPVEQPPAAEPPKLPDFIDPDDEQSVRLWGAAQVARVLVAELQPALEIGGPSVLQP